MAERATLDESQRRVAEAGADARAIVTAGAGQGKTEVVAARLAHLVDTEGLDRSDDVLVLSFSRAAVAAVRRRLLASPAGDRAAVRTFDSFAARLLLDAGEEPAGWSFDRRIREATRLLRDGEIDVPTVDLSRHVVVDEIQDLVGDRGELVLALLDRLPGDAGFTVLGDPLQGIYDFQLGSSKSPLTSADLLHRLRDRLRARDLALEHNYRAQTNQARGVVSLGTRMRDTPSGKRRHNKARHAVESLPWIGTLADLPLVLPRWQGRTAVLCDTNGQAMVASRTLFEHGIKHRLRRPAEQISVPSWVAAVLGDAPSRNVSPAMLDDLISASGVTVPDDAWRLLKITERRRRAPRELDLVELSRAVSSGAVPVELVDSGDAQVIVSTIHRAKGLEFDNVVLLDDPSARDDGATSTELDRQARALYVALSRARTVVTAAEPPLAKGLRVDEFRRRRWIRGYGWRTSAFEFQLQDAERARPFGTDPETARGVQDLLRTSAISSVGQPVVGRIDPPCDPRNPIYELAVGDQAVARTSSDFAQALIARLDRAWPNHPGPPVGLEDLFTDGVETAAGPPVVGEQLGVGRWGLWLTVRISGLARLKFERNSDA
ncbi:UvrD-helicase domain-containing protein [Actinomycetospora aeridis]|uniref:UvrD-helicase domain-containing protein n=1 Tax=Actinomycetospora aeridis TaxID=3129231 RepID=A0ABU8N8Y4_9PSEU